MVAAAVAAELPAQRTVTREVERARLGGKYEIVLAEFSALRLYNAC